MINIHDLRLDNSDKLCRIDVIITCELPLAHSQCESRNTSTFPLAEDVANDLAASSPSRDFVLIKRTGTRCVRMYFCNASTIRANEDTSRD